MSHDTDGWPVRVFRYGSPGWGGKRAIRLTDHGHEQLQLAHELRNRLVEVAETNDKAMDDWWRERIPVEYAALEAAKQACDDAWTAVMTERTKQRRRDIAGPTADDHLQAKSLMRAASLAVKAAKAATRQLDPAAVKAMTDQTRATNKAAMKSLYHEFSQRGLYWATINSLLADARTAEQRVVSDRTKGLPARRRYARWDGSGRIAVQLQRGAADPTRSIDTLATSKWRKVLHVGPSQHGPRMRRVELTTGGGRPTVGIDVVWHRDLPDGADITGAELTATRVAGRTRYAVCISARVPPPTVRSQGPAIALHLGWRKEPDGVRVAAWRADQPVAVPERLTWLITQDTDVSGRVIVPRRLLDRLAAADQVHGLRDVMLDEIREKLTAFLRVHPQPPLREGWDELTASTAARWKSPNRFAAVALAWRNDPNEEIDEIAEAMESWRVQDRAAWEREANGRARAVRWRREMYRLVAAWMATVAGRVVVCDTDLRRIISTPKTGDVVPGTVEDEIAGRRADVSPGDLRAAVKMTATREGVPVVEVPHKGLTVVHHACGRAHEPGPEFLRAVITCVGCGRRWDQDANATVGMLARARALQSAGG